MDLTARDILHGIVDRIPEEALVDAVLALVVVRDRAFQKACLEGRPSTDPDRQLPERKIAKASIPSKLMKPRTLQIVKNVDEVR